MLDRVNMYDYQLALTAHVKEGASSLAFVEMGLGKTVSVLTAISDIIDTDYRNKGLLRRFLVVAPKRVATMTWPDEVKKWRHLEHLRLVVAQGGARARAHALTNPKAHIVTINYENLKWLMDLFPRGQLPFYGLILDEIDKVKAVGTARFKALRYRAHEFDWRVGMTGTPTPEHLSNLWAPTYLITSELAVDPPSRYPPAMNAALGSSYERFKSQYFIENPHSHKVLPRQGTTAAIAKKIAQYTFQARAKDHLELPGIMIQDIHYEIPAPAMKMYRDLEAEFVVALDKYGLSADDTWDEDDAGAEVEAVNAAVLKNKLRQLCSGFLYHTRPLTPDELAEVRQTGIPLKPKRGTRWVHPGKMAAYQDLVSELQGEPHLAVYGYHAEVDRLAFKYRFGKGVSAREERETKALWDAREIETLAMHPMSAGHGLNLHEGGAHHIAFLTLPWSRGLYDQVIARLHRMGQERSVIVHRFVAKGTVEEDVVAALEAKGEVQEQVIAAIKRRVAA